MAASEVGLSEQAPAAGDPTAPLDESAPVIDVIGISPLLGTGIDIDKLPNRTRVLRSQDLSRRGTPSLTGALDDQLGAVGLNQTSGNQNQPDFEFRGFAASPLEGTPQGVAAYQDGVRVNEAFGDTVNWDLIPAFAIDTLDLTSTNPVYGFNALGGGLALRMKDGFNYRKAAAEAAVGSFHRQTGLLQFGQTWGHVGLYTGVSAENDDGWRRSNPSRLRKLYSDFGYNDTHDSLHVSFTGADNTLTGGGPTPEPLLAVDRRAELSLPQVAENHLAMINLRGSRELNKEWSLQADVYSRNFNQSQRDGNGTNAQPCTPPLDPTTLCAPATPPNGPQGQIFDQHGGLVPAAAGGVNPGEIDFSRTSTKSLGATVQATWIEAAGERKNHVVVGSSLDQGNTKFRSGAELGGFDESGHVIGTGIHLAGGSLSPVSLNTTNTYSGVYVTDTFDATSAMSVTLSARYNDALIQMNDQLGASLNGAHHYGRINPSAGLAYQIVPRLTWYGNYAESNRAPTAAELSCADPAQSCTLASFFVADPELKQVVAKTFETGVRGSYRLRSAGRIQWNLGVFRTDSSDDIIEVASPTAGRGFFQNAGTTRRQGVELSAGYKGQAWRIAADYGHIEATFRSPLDLSSPNNPAADADGHIHVAKGAFLPGIPKDRLKLGVDYAVVAPWSVGVVVTAASPQYLRGDEANQTAKLGGYTLLGLHSEYRIMETLQLWASLDNVLNRRYESSGAFTNANGVPLPALPGGSLDQTRTVAPGPPLEGFAGIRYAL